MKMMRRKRSFLMVCALSIVMAMGVAVAWPQTSGLGIFTNEGSVGQTPPGVKAQYDAAKGEYRITGGGANMWGATDAFYFVWKKVSGDVSLSADIQWVGTSAAEHRKAVLIVRQSLDPGSPYADAVSHGNGLTSLAISRRGERADLSNRRCGRWTVAATHRKKGQPLHDVFWQAG